MNREGERATGGERAGSADGPGGPAWLRAGPSGPGGSFSFLFVLLCLIFPFLFWLIVWAPSEFCKIR